MSRSSAILARVLNSPSPRIGPFRLVRALGAGGFAPVYLATETYGEVDLRSVALKLFAIDTDEESPSSRGTPAVRTGTGTLRGTRDMILEEARALCRVEHPNVVRFLQIATDETGCVFGLAMEHVQGRSLASRLETEMVLSLDATLEMGAAIASALAAVHEVGLVHRDVKPPNIIETPGGYKLIDFGIASNARMRRRAQHPPASVPVVIDGATFDTMPAVGVDGASEGYAAGTPGYMDPVCMMGEPADVTSDLYALGATMFECVTGRLPSSVGAGPLASKLRTDIVAGVTPPPPVRSIAPLVPEEVARLIDALVSPTRDARPRHAASVAVEVERLRRSARGGRRDLPPEGPFRGLGCFDARHRDVYFGRAAEVASAVELLRARGLVALLGTSGSGKSSLARAGVVPAVCDGALGHWPPAWRAVVLTPRGDARLALAQALQMHLPHDPEQLAQHLTQRVEADNVGVLLVVDQLEELVTMGDDAGRAYLAALLARFARAPVPGMRALVTARRDLLDPLLAVPDLGSALVRGAQLVAPLGRDAWVSVLEDGLAAYGFRLEDPEMRAAIARELAVTAESMPLVAFALSALWDERDPQRRVVPRAAIAKLGGIAGALERHADATLHGLAQWRGPQIAEVARRVLVALTTARGTRARRAMDELVREARDPRAPEVVAALERARLLVAEDGRYALAHEALLTQWRTLRAWIEAVREERVVAAEVEEAASAWAQHRERDRLWRGRPLASAMDVARRGNVPLSEAARAFVAASRRWDRRGKLGLLALTLTVCAGAPAMYLSYRQAEAQTRAEKRAAQGFARDLMSARAAPEVQRAQAIEQLIREKTTCEKELARARGELDGGLEPASPIRKPGEPSDHM